MALTTVAETTVPATPFCSLTCCLLHSPKLHIIIRFGQRVCQTPSTLSKFDRLSDTPDSDSPATPAELAGVTVAASIPLISGAIIVQFNRSMIGLLALITVTGSVAESAPKIESSSSANVSTGGHRTQSVRWYSFGDVTLGGKVFKENCATCHGAQGEGAPDWKKIGADGKYPAPPLNGTGHAWHHPLRILYRVVKLGSPGGQGGMPAWGEKLSDGEMVAAIAWFQSKWPDRIYAAWMEREVASRAKD